MSTKVGRAGEGGRLERGGESEAGAIEWKRKVFELIYWYDDKEMAMACAVWEGKEEDWEEMRIELGFGFGD